MSGKQWIPPVHVRSLIRSGQSDLVPVESLAPTPRRWHDVDGAIELTVGGTAVLTAAQRDDIRDLWAYLTVMVQARHDGEPEAHTYYPDQPIRVTFTRLRPPMVEIRCDIGPEQRRAVTAVDEPVRELAVGAASAAPTPRSALADNPG